MVTAIFMQAINRPTLPPAPPPVQKTVTYTKTKMPDGTEVVTTDNVTENIP